MISNFVGGTVLPISVLFCGPVPPNSVLFGRIALQIGWYFAELFCQIAFRIILNPVKGNVSDSELCAVGVLFGQNPGYE